MNPRILLTTAALSAALPSAMAVVFADGHQDIRFNYAAGTGWSTAIYDHETGIVHTPEDVLFEVGAAAENERPAGGQWDFTGAAAGDTIWLLPQTQTLGLPWIGISTQQTAGGGAVFVNNDMKLTLTGFSGPGDFSTYTVGSLGGINVLMATSDGLSAADAIGIKANSHAHYSYVFSQPGDYTLTFQASGTLVAGLGGGLTTSEPFDVNFTVVPEPGAYATALGLLALGGALLRRRRG